MQDFISFLTKTETVVGIAVLILAGALFAYLFWFRPAHQATLVAVNRMKAAFLQDSWDWPSVQERANAVLKSFPLLSPAWLETRDRVIEVDVKGNRRAVMFSSPRDLWNPTALLSQRFNLSLADAVPNILVGVGLLFTFLFLTVALMEATQALGPGVSQEATQDAIGKLLSAAGGKFVTSLAGLLASLVWTYVSKRSSKNLTVACHDLLAVFAQRIAVNGAEILTIQQSEGAKDALALSEELLSEAREQTGTFKRFETDLAVTLAGAINKAFTPQMEAMTAKLVASIDGLSEKLGSMNQEALQKMLEDFAAMLQEATKTEMAQLQQTLAELAQKLSLVGSDLGEGGQKIKDDLENAGAVLVARVQEIAQNLATGAQNLDTAAGAVKVAMNDLEVTMLEASNIGKRGALFVNEALEKTGQTLQDLGVITNGLVTASSDFNAVAGKISEVVDNVEELSREQRGVVAAVREVAPTAQAAVERVANVLEHAGQHTKDSMEATAASLTRTVSSITEGLSSYTDLVAELHRKMDANLANAVGNFHTHVNELTEAVEELSEIMQQKKD